MPPQAAFSYSDPLRTLRGQATWAKATPFPAKSGFGGVAISLSSATVLGLAAASKMSPRHLGKGTGGPGVMRKLSHHVDMKLRYIKPYAYLYAFLRGPRHPGLLNGCKWRFWIAGCDSCKVEAECVIECVCGNFEGRNWGFEEEGGN